MGVLKKTQKSVTNQRKWEVGRESIWIREGGSSKNPKCKSLRLHPKDLEKFKNQPFCGQCSLPQPLPLHTTEKPGPVLTHTDTPSRRSELTPIRRPRRFPRTRWGSLCSSPGSIHPFPEGIGRPNSHRPQRRLSSQEGGRPTLYRP